MARTINEQALMAGIERAIQAEIDCAVEEATNEVLEKVRKSVRERLGQVACGLLGQYEVFKDQHRLVITVDIKDQG